MALELRLVKRATDEQSARRLAREAQWLRELAAVRDLEGQLPRLIEYGMDYLVISIPPGTGETRAFTTDHARFLATLGRARFRTAEFEHSAKCEWLQRSLQELPEKIPLLEAAYGDCESALLYWSGPYVLSQGDFAPWNIRTLGSQLFVCDWGDTH